jgi:ribosomal protein L1
MEADIRVEHADQRHVREIEALRNHLRADQHVRVAAPEALAEIASAAGARDIGVEPQDAGAGKRGEQLTLDALCAARAIAEQRGMAVGTRGRSARRR